MKTTPLSRRAPVSSGALLIPMAALGLGTSQAALVGVNFQGNNYGFGPYTPTTSAFTVPAANWINLAPAASGSASNSGLTASYTAAGSWVSFGYAYANVGPGPTTDDERVLAGNLYGNSGTPITLTLDLGAPGNYTYTLTSIASQDNGTGFLNPVINDGTGSTNPSWGAIIQGGQWNGANTSPRATLTQSGTTTGDTITLTITGDDGPAGLRNALAGLTIDFTPVPEPGAAALAAAGLLTTLRRRRQ